MLGFSRNPFGGLCRHQAWWNPSTSRESAQCYLSFKTVLWRMLRNIPCVDEYPLFGVLLWLAV